MFMVTATGTACVIRMPKQETITEIEQVSFEQIRRKYLTNFYKQNLIDHKLLTDKDWETINSLNLSEIMPLLTSEYFRLKSDKSSNTISIQYLDNFYSKYTESLSLLNKEEAEKCIYPFIDSYPDIIVELVIKFNLFNPKVVLKQISDGNISLAIKL